MATRGRVSLIPMEPFFFFSPVGVSPGQRRKRGLRNGPDDIPSLLSSFFLFFRLFFSPFLRTVGIERESRVAEDRQASGSFLLLSLKSFSPPRMSFRICGNAFGPPFSFPPFPPSRGEKERLLFPLRFSPPQGGGAHGGGGGCCLSFTPCEARHKRGSAGHPHGGSTRLFFFFLFPCSGYWPGRAQKPRPVTLPFLSGLRGRGIAHVIAQIPFLFPSLLSLSSHLTRKEGTLKEGCFPAFSFFIWFLEGHADEMVSACSSL